MLDAYECQRLLKLPGQAQSIAAYDDKLLVGTKAGHLLMFDVTSRPNETKRAVQLLRYNKTFSKKPILQLSVVPEHDILISLSDSVISVHNVSNNFFDLIKTFPQTKGASVFTLDVQKPKSLTGGTSVTVVRMCVAVKKKLQFYYWKNSEFLPLTDEVTLHDTPKALCWSEEAICVGFKEKYRLFFLAGEQKELFPTGKQLEPSIIKMNENTFVIGKENQSTFINNKGDAALISMLKWPELPLALVYDDPYLVAILRESVMVQTVDPMLTIQTLPIKDGQVICRCKQGIIYVATTEHVYCVLSVSRERQIRILLEQKQFQLALKLTNTSDNTEEDKKKNIHQIQTLYAFDLFRNKKFLESMKEFIELETDPYEVIQLFPNLLPQQARGGSSSSSSQVASSDATSVNRLEDKDLESGLMALIEYLTMVRHKLISKDTKSKKYQQLIQIIDTTLLKCYLQTNDALVAPLLRRKNCHLDETERTLKKYHKYNELVILYQTNDLHHKALELLQKQADQPDSSLRGHEWTVQYLQGLGKEHIGLIFQFASWVLEKHPEDGLKIFTEDLPEVEQLPRPRVLDYLLKTQKSLVIQYLEHVIHVWKETNSIFHNVLIHQYREKVQQLCVFNAAGAAADPETQSPMQAEQQQGNNIRAKLLKFLEQSDHYVPEAVLIHFPFDSMYEERAVILEKLGRHEQALSIYVTIMNNVQLAVQYCDRVYNKGRDDQVYVLLIKLLICPPENWLGGVTAPEIAKPDLELALIILEDYADRIPPMKALKELPDDVPLQRIQKFLMTSLQKQLNHRRRTQVLKGLLYAEHLQVQEYRMHYESKSVLMTELNVCPVCKKKFGNQSAFVRYPNGEILHYSCRFIKDQDTNNNPTAAREKHHQLTQ